MLAYHGDPKLKRAMLREVRKHEKADQIIAGTYGEGEGAEWRGCAVGCSIHSLAKIKGRELDTRSHVLFETEAGVPLALARLQDAIFEGLPASKRAAFPAQFWSAIRPGADLSRVSWQFLHWLLTDSGVAAFNDPSVAGAVKQCANVIEPLTRGEPVDREAAYAASAATYAAYAASAAAYAAYAASVAAYAAYAADAADAAASAATYAAYAASAAAYAAAYAASAAAYAAAYAASVAAYAAYAADAADAAAYAAYAASAAARRRAHSRFAKKLVELLAAA